jgi:hypothetical protein
MSLELKEGAETTGLPTITLAGKPYYIARLVLREIIAVSVLMPKVSATLQKFPKTKEEIATATLTFEDGDFEPMIDLVRCGLRRLYPAVTREILLEMEIEIIELVTAVHVIVEQSGGKRTDADAGELAAANDSTSSTGASSSPTS